MYGLYRYGLCRYGLYRYGLYSDGIYRYGLYSYGPYSDGAYSYGLYSYGLHKVEDYDLTTNDFIGSTAIDIAELADGKPRRRWHKLRDSAGNVDASLGMVELLIR